MPDRRILVTSALPYANGPIHIGHLVEYIQTDIWVRFQKLRGHRCIYICADDTHGTAIMISAKKQGVTEEQFIARMHGEHQRDFAGFGIEFDNYGSTNSDENRELCHDFWSKIRAAGLVKEKDVEQLYDPEAKTFLADRFVKGTCPVCKKPNQYGDSCDNGHHYRPVDLLDPVSTLSGATPEIRTEKHLFIELEQLHGFLEEWSQCGKYLQDEVANYLKGHFLHEPLRDWDVSRPAPYFGFEIPGYKGQYWYVWFDAPIGYIASTWAWCKRNGEQLDDWWKSDKIEIHHFIGKDITYFHTLFWPGMLKTAGYTLPTKVHIHGFLTVGGEKMSKSKGTFVKAETYLKHLNPQALRYFYASKLGSSLADLDLNPLEFVTKFNSDIVGKLVNIASRTAKFVENIGLCDEYPDDGGLFEQGAQLGEKLAPMYENCDFYYAMQVLMIRADKVNQYVEANKPWELAKDKARIGDLQKVCTVALNLFRQLVVYISPVLPQLSKQVGALLNQPIASWEDAKTPLLGTRINAYEHLYKRINLLDVEAMIEESKQEAAAAAPASEGGAPTWNDTGDALAAEPLAAECTIEDFGKVDLRVARVITAEEVPEAKKLLKLTVSLGGDVRRTVFAGIKAAYEPGELVGRLVVMVANLKPRQMKFGLSEGMVCASGPGGEDVFLLAVDSGAVPGQRVH